MTDQNSSSQPHENFPHYQRPAESYPATPQTPVPLQYAGQPVQYGQPEYPQQTSAPQQNVYVNAYARAQPRGLSTASMVLGLISLAFGFTFVVPIVGFILGIVGLRREPTGRGMAVTGLILNGLFVVGWAIVVAFFVFAAIAASASVSGSSVN